MTSVVIVSYFNSLLCFDRLSFTCGGVQRMMYSFKSLSLLHLILVFSNEGGKRFLNFMHALLLSLLRLQYIFTFKFDIRECVHHHVFFVLPTITDLFIIIIIIKTTAFFLLEKILQNSIRSRTTNGGDK